MRSQRPIVVVGSINSDLVSLTHRIPIAGETVLGTRFQVHPGGKGANQAVAVARLGYPVQLVGRVGDDAFGDQLRSHLVAAGVDTSGVSTTEGSSGIAAIVVSASGENSIVVTPGANAHVSPQDLEANIDIIRQAGVVLVQLEIPIDTVEYLASICRRQGVPLILDPAPALDLPPRVLKDVEWLTPNQVEAAFYLKDERTNDGPLDPVALAKMLLAQGSRGVVLKMGERGVHIATGDGFGESLPAFSVDAVDTTAAGDAFNGGFATALMLGRSPIESARFAAAVAGISVTRTGAQPSMPSMAEVNEFLETASVRAY